MWGVRDGVDEVDLAVVDAECDGAQDVSVLGDEYSGVAVYVSDGEVGSVAGGQVVGVGSDVTLFVDGTPQLTVPYTSLPSNTSLLLRVPSRDRAYAWVVS